jgi:hypothetical protein
MSQAANAAEPGGAADAGSLDARFSASFLARKRGADRHQMPSQITVEAIETYAVMHEVDPRFWVTSRDISRTGISFYSFFPLYYGERIRLELRLDRGQIRYVDAMVVRCRCLHNGTCEVGARFTDRQLITPRPEPLTPKVPDIPWIFR